MAEFISKKLKKWDGYWRVDGIGKVRNRGAHGISCDVHFQYIKSEYAERAENSPYSTSAGTAYQFSISVHIATLSHFKVGTIWKHGKLWKGPADIGQELEIDVANCQYVRLGEEARLGDHRIPTVLNERYTKLGSGAGKNREGLKDSYFALAPVLGNPNVRWIVIPASEILRFYYGPSSPMLTSVVRGRIGDYISLNPRESYLNGTEVVLRVRRRLKKLEALALARFIASPQAMYEARHVHEYLVTRSANIGGYPERNAPQLTLHARFPFNDRTCLRVKGKRVKMVEITADGASEDIWGVFAMEIIECSHPLGYDRIRKVTDQNIPTAEGVSAGRRGPPSILQPTYDEDDALETIDAPPNARLQRLSERIIANPFRDMPTITFRNERAGEGDMGTIPGEVTAVAVEALSMGEGIYANSSRNILGNDSFLSPLQRTSRDIGIFLKMLSCLRIQQSSAGWTIATKALSESSLFDGEHIVSFPRRMGPRRTWHLVQDDGHLRPRQIVLVEISFPDGRICYLLEMELRPTEDGQCTLLLYSQDFSEISEPTFQNLFRLSALKRRWISPETRWDEGEQTEAHICANFLATHTSRRIGHPHVQTESHFDGSKQAIDPEHWATYLAEKIMERLFPS